MAKARNQTYGSSLHYSGESGALYLSWQDAYGQINGMIDAKKFAKFNFNNGSLLDFGSGTGNLLARLDAPNKFAVEVNKNAHAILKQRGFNVHETIEEIASESIQNVISNHALEHVPYPIGALKEIRRVLVPGGTFVLCVPIDDWRSQKTYNKNDINHHLNTWSPQLLGNSLTEAGFEIEKSNIQIINHAWIPLYHRFYKFPFFDLLCRIWAITRNRRQLLAVVRK